MIKNFQDYNNIIKYDNAVAELAEQLKEKLMQSFTIIFLIMLNNKNKSAILLKR